MTKLARLFLAFVFLSMASGVIPAAAGDPPPPAPNLDWLQAACCCRWSQNPILIPLPARSPTAMPHRWQV